MLPGYQLLTVVAALGIIALLLNQALEHDPTAAQTLALTVSRDPRLLSSFTGRVPLWSVIWLASQNKPLGFGFAAGERTLVEIVGRSAGWTATNAHNGFIAAWLAAGWIGVCLIGSVFFAVVYQALARGYRERAFVIAACIFLAVNNLSYPGIGSIFNVAWFAMMALACAHWTLEERSTLEYMRHS
jgi:O-antigen ligase